MVMIFYKNYLNVTLWLSWLLKWLIWAFNMNRLGKQKMLFGASLAGSRNVLIYSWIWRVRSTDKKNYNHEVQGIILYPIGKKQ